MTPPRERAGMILGLTGGYCAGKNAVAAMLEKEGFCCIDVDRVGHEVLRQPDTAAALRAHFGPSILDKNGDIDRKALGAIVFKNQAELLWEEGIVHPAVSSVLAQKMAAAGGRDICLNAALLYRMKEAALCGAIIEVKAPLYARVIRGCARDDLGIIAVLRRIASQRNFWKLRRKAGVPVIILNNKGRPEELPGLFDAALASARKAAAGPRA